MRNLIVFCLVLIASVSFGQRVISDTLQGNETVTFTAMQDASQVQALCTQLGGTSDGTLILKGSVDGTTYVTLSETAGLINFYPNDTLTITNGAAWLITIKESLFNYYKVVGAGTASDTTLVSINWSKR
jgi:hypothetical protein